MEKARFENSSSRRREALRVLGYVRVSSRDQMDGSSLDARGRTIEYLCEQGGCVHGSWPCSTTRPGSI